MQNVTNLSFPLQGSHHHDKQITFQREGCGCAYSFSSYVIGERSNSRKTINQTFIVFFLIYLEVQFSFQLIISSSKTPSVTQLTFTCSKSPMEKLEKGVKCV